MGQCIEANIYAWKHFAWKCKGALLVLLKIWAELTITRYSTMVLTSPYRKAELKTRNALI